MKFRFSKVVQWLQLMYQALHQHWQLWWMANEARGWQRMLAFQREKLERLWNKWDHVRSKREKEKVRRELRLVDQALSHKEARVASYRETLEQKRARISAIIQLLLRGEIDTTKSSAD